LLLVAFVDRPLALLINQYCAGNNCQIFHFITRFGKAYIPWEITILFLMGFWITARIKPQLMTKYWKKKLLHTCISEVFALITSGIAVSTLNLAFLAPDIIESIISGHQLANLNTERLLKRSDLPLDWTEQRQLLGVS